MTKVLLIEDNPADMELIKEYLSGFSNFQIESTDNMRLGLDLASKANFDVLLLDLNLPDSDTGETLEIAKSISHKLPVILLTGLNDQALAQKAIHDGVQDYLVKGEVNADSITRAIKYAIERHELRTELETSNTDLESFAYVASHDLREPLRKIIAFGNILERDCADNLSENGKKYISRMQKASERMQNLLEDLLAYSRIGRHTPNYEKIDLNKIINIVLENLELSIEESRAQIHIEGELPTIDAEENHMIQVFQNLLANAIKFKQKDLVPIINIYSNINDSICEINIQDNGIGFEEKYKDKVFGQFQRLHGRSEYEGSGIGLATCKKIIEHHNGSIDAVSKLNQGSTFTISLPLKQKIAPVNIQTSYIESS